MPKFDLSQPLGLPEGSIRGLLAIIMGAAVAVQWVVQIPVSPEQLVLTTGVVTYYFSKRQSDDPAPAPIQPVYIPGEDKNG